MQFKQVNLRGAFAKPDQNFSSVAFIIPGPAPEEGRGSPPSASEPRSKSSDQIRRQAADDIATNLLTHIPGEASGFYLLSVNTLDKITTGRLGFIFLLSLILLVAVRWLAQASMAVMLTTIGAFCLWMLIFGNGFFHALLPNLLPPSMGFIIAAFYSALITVLASAGKLK